MGCASLEELHALRLRLCSAELDQGHLFVGWPNTAEAYTPAQVAFLEDLEVFRRHYHGGVEQYIRNGKALLKKLEQGGSEYLALERPLKMVQAPNLFEQSALLSDLESRGVALLPRTVFVLVAGGLGERLGYSGIKVGLPVETATGKCYLEHYLTWIKTLAGVDAQVVIMTSSDTHESTIELLKRLALGMPNVQLLKQEMVFCFQDSDAHLACGKDGKLLRKPHGHGDVHSLINAATMKDPESPGRSLPLTEVWQKKGYKYVCFFQDTNGTAVFTIPISLAISEMELLDVNFTCIPRQPKEAVGLMCRVKVNEAAAEGSATADPPTNWKTINIEYNTFADVARMLTKEAGDVAAENSEYSPFPGNINTLIMALPSYAAKLTASKGQVPEFINPKFTDDTHRQFKKPSRVESLMQDIALLFSEGAKDRVGGVVFDRFAFQPVKNSLDEAMPKVQQQMEPYCPSSGEADFYEFTRRRLRAVGLTLPSPPEPDLMVRGCIPVKLFPIVTMDAVARGDGTLGHLARVFPSPSKVRLGSRSTLLIEGRVVVHSLVLNGALRLVGPREPNAAPLVVQDLVVDEPEWGVKAVTTGNEIDTMRGYILVKEKCAVVDGTAKI